MNSIDILMLALHNECQDEKVRLIRSEALKTWRVEGAEYQVRPVKDNVEHLQLLRRKLVEECMEVLNSNRDNIAEEIGDAVAVLTGMTEFFGISWRDVVDKMWEKEDKSGSFNIGMVWDRTIEKDGEQIDG